jgi:hypothetical protein
MTPAPWTSRRLGRATLALAIVLAMSDRVRADEAPPASEAPASSTEAERPAPGAGEPEPPAPAPMTADAREHYQEGLRLYADRKFTAAIREFEAGFALEPRREFLFAEAQAYRLAGDCTHAIPIYERFLGSGPSPLQVDATRLALDRCARRPAAAPPPAKPVPPAPARPAGPPVAERERWWRDRWALGAVAAGVVATGVGVGFKLAADSAAAQANGATTRHYDDYSRLWDTADRRQTISIAALAGGAALLATGAVRFLWVRHKEAGAAPAAVTTLIWPASGGGSLVGQVSF